MTSQTLRSIAIVGACMASLMASSGQALAAGPTASYSGSVANQDTNRPMPQGVNAFVIGDLNVSVLGTSTVVAKISAGSGAGVCEGFSGLAAQLQRASIDPYGPYAAYVAWSSSGSALSGNGSVAIAETGVGWYRWNITSVTGTGNCVITYANK